MCKCFIMKDCIHFVVLIFLSVVHTAISDTEEVATELYNIEGKVQAPEPQGGGNWQAVTRVIVNGGEYLGFLNDVSCLDIIWSNIASQVEKAFCVLEYAKTNSITLVQCHYRTKYGKQPPTRQCIYDWVHKFEETVGIFQHTERLLNLTCHIPPNDVKATYITHTSLKQNKKCQAQSFNYVRMQYREDGSFVIHNVPSGSYVVEVFNPNFAYEPVRVEINSKGKYRARKVNYIQTSQVLPMPYPLRMKPLSRFRYFQVREQWRVTDFLFSPMVLMMVLPLVLIMVLPKMMNDPETRKEMEQLNNFKYDMPEVSEVLTSFFAGGEKQKSRAVKSSKKRQ